MRKSEFILVNGESYHPDEFLDEDGTHDLPPPIDAETLGVSERTISTYKQATGFDYHRLYWHFVNRRRSDRTPQMEAWQYSYRLWKQRQGFRD